MSTLILIIKIFTVGFLSFLILGFNGYGLTRLLELRRYNTYAFLIMPLVGYAFLITIAMYMCWIGIWTKDYFWIPLLLALLINIATIPLIKNKNPLFFFPSELIFPLAVAAIVFFIGLIPLLVMGHLTTIGYNGDAVFTSLLAKYLPDHGLITPEVSFDRPYTIETWYLNSGYWLGFIFFQTFIDQIFHLDPYQSFSLLTAFFLALIPLTCYFFCRCLLELEKRETRLVLLLLAINAALYWLHYDDFAANIVGISLILLLVSLLVLAMEEYNLKTALLAALIFSAFLNTYPWMLGYILSPIGIYLVYLWRWQKKPFSLLIRTLVKTTIFALCLNPLIIIRIIRLLSWLSMLPKAYIGGNIHEFLSLTELYGLSHHRLIGERWYLSPYFQTFILFIFIGALTLTFYGLITTSNRKRALLLSLAIPSVINFFYLRFVADYPYGFFKNISMSITITIILFAMGLFSLYGILKIRPWPGLIGSKCSMFLPGLLLSFAGAYILINIYCLTLLTKVTSKSLTLNLSALIDLSTKIKSLNIQAPIYLKDDKETRMLWLIYFLENQRLVLNSFSPLIYYEMYPHAKPKDFYQDGISQDYILAKRGEDMLPIYIEKVLYENTEYQLLKKKPGVLYHLDLKPRPLLLHNRDKVKIIVKPGGVEINSKLYRFPHTLSPKGQKLWLRLFVPRGAGYLWEQDGIKKAKRLGRDTGEIKKELNHLSQHIEITNLSPRTIIIPWLEITEEKKDLIFQDSIFNYFPQPILPDTEFFIIAGWHGLEQTEEEKIGRWTGANGISLFRNPREKSLLKIKGEISEWAMGKQRVPQVKIFLNGFQLDTFTPQDQEFTRELILDGAILGNSKWCELSFTVDKTIVPHLYMHSGDKRELGIKITSIQRTGYYHPREKIFPGSEFYPLKGWHELEYKKTQDQAYRWTKANARILFRNPHKKSLLKIKGEISQWAMRKNKVPQIKISLNGSHIDTFTSEDQEFVRELVLDKTILGDNHWCELSFTVDKTIAPHQYEHSSDRRELGLKITNIQRTDYYYPQEKIFPNSEFYPVKGWHELEYDETKDQPYRWTKANARLLFRNSYKKSVLQLKAEIPHLDMKESSRPTILILLNGKPLAKFTPLGKNIMKNFVLEKNALGSEAWCELELITDKIFVPKRRDKKEDPRELGIKVTWLDLHDYFALPEKVLPDPVNDIYVVTGWHELEYGNKITRAHPRRWTEALALALIKNPGGEGILEVAGALPPISFPSPPIVKINLQGKEIDKFSPASKQFYREIPVSKDLLGLSPWLELTFSIDQVFIPDVHFKTGDQRQLGICITRVNFEKRTLDSWKTDTIIDFGTPEAQKYILGGWSWNETWPDGRKFSWACKKESLLKIDLTKVSDYVMNLKILPIKKPPNSPQQITVYLNGDALTKFNLIHDEWLEYQVFLPYDYLSNLETHTLRFVYKYLDYVPDDSRNLSVAFDLLSFTKTGLQRILPESGLYIGQGWYELEGKPKTGRYWRRAKNGAQLWLKKPWEATSLSLKGELITDCKEGPCQVQLWSGKKELARIKTLGRTFASNVMITPEIFPNSTWRKLSITTTQEQDKVGFEIHELRLKERVLPNSPAQVIRGWSDLEEAPYGQDYWRWTEDAAEAYLPGRKKEGYWQILGEILPLKAYSTPPRIKLEYNKEKEVSFVPLNSQFVWQYTSSKESAKLKLRIDQTVIPDRYYHNGDQRRVGVKIKGIRYLDHQKDSPGLFIDLGEKMARDYLRSGWSGNERWDDMTSFVWAAAKEVLLQFSLPNKADYFLNLRLMPFTFPESPQQTIKVYLNDKFLAEILPKRTEWQIYQLLVRANNIARKGPQTLRLVHSYTQKPIQILASSDHRDLAVAYDYISFVPAPPITNPPWFFRLKRKLYHLWARYR